MVYLLPFFKLISWLKKRFRPPAHPSDPDTMTNSALEAIALSSGNEVSQISFGRQWEYAKDAHHLRVYLIYSWKR